MSKKNDRGISPAAFGALAKGDLENFLVAATPGGIETQEAMGQAAFVGTRDTLPLKFNYCKKEDFEKMGIVFGKVIDNLFQEATLPQGWTKKATDHSMWSDLIDDKGRKRASIFYKAAFYDREAFINTVRRFSVQRDYDREGVIVIQVRDCGSVVFETEPVVAPKDRSWEVTDAQTEIAEAWLTERYPNHDDATAYWD